MLRVVVADGDRDTRELYDEYLRAMGCDVVTAATGEEALYRCQESTPHILLTEIALPGLDGIALCRSVRESPQLRDLPILVVTAVAHPHYITRGKIAGANCTLIKPVTPEAVFDALQHVVRRWPGVRHRAAALQHMASRLAASLARHDGPRATSAEWELHALALDDGALVGAVLNDRAGFCMGANQTAADLIGCTRADLMTRPIWDSLPPRKRLEGRAMWRWFLTSGELHGAVTLVTKTGDASDFQYSAMADVLRGAHLTVFAPHALGHDLSALKAG